MSDAVADALNIFLADVSTHFGKYLMAVAMLGLLAMSVIEAVKNLVPIRRWFQHYELRKWLRRHAEGGSNVQVVLGAESDLVFLATDGDATALFDLPLEQLCGQLNAALSQALDYPARYHNLLHIVVARADRNDPGCPEKLRSNLDFWRGVISGCNL